MNFEQEKLQEMRSLLHHNVPRFIKHIGQRGGVSNEEWEWLKRDTEDPNYPEGIMARADEYLLYPKDEETFRQGLFVLVKMLAIMSFIPNGVMMCGLHFDFDIVGFVQDENPYTPASRTFL